MKHQSSAKSARTSRAVEAFQSAEACIGPLRPGMSVFALTRGQFSMIDAIMWVISQCPSPVEISLWTWTIAEYEVDCVLRLMEEGKVQKATLVIDERAARKSMGDSARIVKRWHEIFGKDSVRYVLNHAKIATVQCAEYKFLLRGSMNLNHNPRFEQFDLSEGDGAFDLVRQVEGEIPILRNQCSNQEAAQATRVGEAFDAEQLSVFSGLKVWAK